MVPPYSNPRLSQVSHAHVLVNSEQAFAMPYLPLCQGTHSLIHGAWGGRRTQDTQEHIHRAACVGHLCTSPPPYFGHIPDLFPPPPLGRPGVSVPMRLIWYAAPFTHSPAHEGTDWVTTQRILTMDRHSQVPPCLWDLSQRRGGLRFSTAGPEAHSLAHFSPYTKVSIHKFH